MSLTTFQINNKTTLTVENKRSNLHNFGKQYLDCKAKKKDKKNTNAVIQLKCFSRGGGRSNSEMTLCVYQNRTNKYIVNSERWVSHYQRKQLQYRKGDRLNEPCSTELKSGAVIYTHGFKI